MPAVKRVISGRSGPFQGGRKRSTWMPPGNLLQARRVDGVSGSPSFGSVRAGAGVRVSAVLPLTGTPQASE
jgi:hypothetical protein